MGNRSKELASGADGHMSVHKHLLELRGHLFLVAIVFVIFSAIGYVYQKEVLAVLLAPLEGQQLSYLTLAGGFSFIFKITMWCGVAAAIPVLLFALYRFIAPALPLAARSKSLLILPTSLVLMVCGAVFGYFYAIPGAIRFLLEFADEYVNAMLTADSYLNFVLTYTVGLGILFQIPLLMMLINWAKPLRPMKLLAFERWVVLVAFVAAAFITPTPDAVNQCVIALPIIAMYQVGFLSVVLVNWNKGRSSRTYKHRSDVNRAKRPMPTLVPADDVANAQVPPILSKSSSPTQTPSRGHSIDGLAVQRKRTQVNPMTRRPSATAFEPTKVVRNVGELSIPNRHGIVHQRRAIDGVSPMRRSSINYG